MENPGSHKGASLIQSLQQGNARALARCISLVENERPGYEDLLRMLPHTTHCKIIGITGPPGAGKSTLTDALLRFLTRRQFKVAVLCVDPSSPFNQGALLGDRIRLNQWYNRPDVFIRSLATRGSLGGLHPKMIEITELVQNAGFDFIIIETVGVGQNEIDIAGLADVTVVVIVPEAGDDIQTMKAGLMEIADIFVVNKCDRPGADLFVKNLRQQLYPATFKKSAPIPVLKTIASRETGVEALYEQIMQGLEAENLHEKKAYLYAEKAFVLIRHKRMKDIRKKDLAEKIRTLMADGTFNLYRFVENY